MASRSARRTRCNRILAGAGAYVGPYAEADAANTFALYESLDPVLDKEGTRDAYRLEVDLLPMVLEMRRRGIRIDRTPPSRRATTAANARPHSPSFGEAR